MSIDNFRKQLVRNGCSNYDNGFCLLRDTECPLVTTFQNDRYSFTCEEAECTYFDSHVLGDKPMEEVYENEFHEKKYSIKKCKECNKVFKPSNSVSKYCSDSCKKQARKHSNSKYYQASK